MKYVITYGESQEFGGPTRVIGYAETVADARKTIRDELGLKRLQPSRAWVNPSPDVIEGWLIDPSDPDCSDGYFIEETD